MSDEYKGDDMMRRYEITDEEWNKIKDLLPSDTLPHQGRPPKPNREILNGILWIARSGAPWRDLPERFGPWQTVYYRFNKWAKTRVFEKIFEILNIDADMQDLSLDSSCIKVHQHAAGAHKDAENSEKNQEIGMTRGGKNTKIHAVVDALGNPVKLIFSGGHVSDCTVAVDILSQVEISGSVILADKAYGTKDIREYIENQDSTYCIPPKSNAKDPWECDYHHYKERHVVECFFQKLKQFRRVATRYEKLITCFKGIVFLASIMILVK